MIHIFLLFCAFVSCSSWIMFILVLAVVVIRMNTVNILPIDFKGYKIPKKMVFVYGKDKPFMFHDKTFIDIMEGMYDDDNNNGGTENTDSENRKVYEVTGGHWVSVKHEEKLKEIIDERIRRL